jgi:ferredoxin
MKVLAHQEKCVSAGQCAMLAPDVFDQRDTDGVVVLLNAHPRADQDNDVRDAADACPARAIEIGA